MPVPPLSVSEPIVAQRLESFEEMGNTQVNKAVFYIACGGCDFEEWDRAFTAFPDRAFRNPEDLAAFVEALAANNRTRKCPECHAMAELRGLRAFVMAGSLERDLVVEHDPAQPATSYLFLDIEGSVAQARPHDPRVHEACLDSCLRAAFFHAEIGADRLRAQELFDHVVAGRPREAIPLLHKARLLFEQDAVKETLRCVELASEMGPANPEACVLLGGILGDLAMSQEDPTLLNRALDSYQQALELDTEPAPVQLAMGKLLVQTGNFELAEDALRQAATSPMHESEARYLQGVAHLRQNRNREAGKVFSDLAAYGTSDPSVIHMLAWALAREGRKADARRALSEAERYFPGNQDTQYFRELVEQEPAPSTEG